MSGYFPGLSERFAAFAKGLKGERVCVMGHAKPDGDCIGSQVALTRLLRNLGVDAFAMNADPAPKALAFLIEETKVLPFEFGSLESLPLIYVDCADEKRVGPKTSVALAEHRMLANIDHHISNTKFSENDFVVSQAAATCEILAGIAYDLDWEIDAQTALALYVGILTDTGRFSYAATSPRVFELASRLVGDGASPTFASTHLYERERMQRLKLLERFLDSLALECDDRICIGVVRQQDFLDTGAAYEDTEGFVDYARSIDGVEVGILIEERKTMTKGSLRSNDAAYRMDRIAAAFGGGGHACAAGLSSPLKAEELKSGLLKAIGERLDDPS